MLLGKRDLRRRKKCLPAKAGRQARFGIPLRLLRIAAYTDAQKNEY